MKPMVPGYIISNLANHAALAHTSDNQTRESSNQD